MENTSEKRKAIKKSAKRLTQKVISKRGKGTSKCQYGERRQSIVNTKLAYIIIENLGGFGWSPNALNVLYTSPNGQSKAHISLESNGKGFISSSQILPGHLN